MKHPFPKHRLSTLTRANILLFLVNWHKENKKAPTSAEVANSLIGHPACVAHRHIRRVEALRPIILEEISNGN